MISGYSIQKEIGNGGMATVYLAVQESVDRLVALKVLRPEFSQSLEYADRFLREAKLAASLSHPNLVTIYDFGNDKGTLFLVMEFLQGQTLKSLMEKDFEEPAVLTAFRHIAGALADVHENGLVHRDLKPDNVVFRDIDNTIPVITDFGVARSVDDRFALTLVGSVIGTPKYMSPEQAAGTPVKPCSDLYSFGIMFYQALVGRLPFKNAIDDGRDNETLILPNEFGQYQVLFDGLLAWDENNRFQSVADILELWDTIGNKPEAALREKNAGSRKTGITTFLITFICFFSLSVFSLFVGKFIFGNINSDVPENEYATFSKAETVDVVPKGEPIVITEDVSMITEEKVAVFEEETVDAVKVLFEYSIQSPPRKALCLTDDPWMMGSNSVLSVKTSHCGAIQINALSDIHVAIVGIGQSGKKSLLWPTSCHSIDEKTHLLNDTLFYPGAERVLDDVAPLIFDAMEDVWVLSSDSAGLCSYVLAFIANPRGKVIGALGGGVQVERVLTR